MTQLIGVIDYDAGNIGSMIKMLEYVGAEVRVVGDSDELRGVDKLILPGVGHFDHGVRKLKNRGLFEPLASRGPDSTPLLGVCLGMQLLMEASEEGEESGLGLIRGRCRRFRPRTTGDKVPHMGWNFVTATTDDGVFPDLVKDGRYYFVHTYVVEPEDGKHCLGTTDYIEPFCSAVDSGDGVRGYQFHPEKSHRYGMELLRSFAADAC
jgi:glutamine amidotransferase